MKQLFVELPAFSLYRAEYLDDEGFRRLQLLLLDNPEAGNVIPDTGGLRKLRFTDKRRQKGTRSGLRVLYYRYVAGQQIWLFTLYDKDEMDDLTKDERKAFAKMLEQELQARRSPK
ncbi:hypothetical protein [Chitinilyticum aquatile]|uniref:hypothetical protein n=1 Tax=Chitinilyticum aquatile TaxID=362520 RepID=UPI00042314B5|nr:hypothetical protein [Chitinilyticum aquatile]